MPSVRPSVLPGAGQGPFGPLLGHQRRHERDFCEIADGNAIGGGQHRGNHLRPVRHAGDAVRQPQLYDLCGSTLGLVFDLSVPSTSALLSPLLDLAATSNSECPSMKAVNSSLSRGFACGVGEILNMPAAANVPRCLHCPAGTSAVSGAKNCALCPRGSYTSGRNFHPIGRIENGRRVRSGLRIRNLFAHRIGPCALCPATSARRWSAKNDSAGGLCLSETHAAFCYCPAGFTGSFCEVNIDVWRLPLPVRPGLHEQKVPARRNLQRLAGEFPVPVPVRIYRRPLGEQNQRRRARLALP